MKYRIAALFVVLVGGYVVVKILTTGPFVGTRLREIAFVWTLATFALSYLGLSKRLHPLSGTVPRQLLVGYMLCIAGASIYDLTFVLDVTAMLVGSVAYSAGFWIAVYFWIVR